MALRLPKLPDGYYFMVGESEGRNDQGLRIFGVSICKKDGERVVQSVGGMEVSDWAVNRVARRHKRTLVAELKRQAKIAEYSEKFRGGK